MIQAVRTMPVSVVVGLLMGIVLAMFSPQLAGFALATYDDLFPVLRMQGHVVLVEADAVTLHIGGEKLRGEECKLIGVYGYTTDANGVRKDAVAERRDRRPTDRSRDAGHYDIGEWRVFPVDSQAVSVQVWTQHHCPGRPVLSKIADVRLVK